jgi:hypothetical protein
MQLKYPERLTPDYSGSLNILMASLSSPVSSPSYYERALRKDHNVVTFGPFRDRAFWEKYAAEVRTHFFYRDCAADYWEDLCTRLTRPCDVVTSQGTVDMKELLAKMPEGFKPDLFLWIDQYWENVPINLDALDCPKIALVTDTHLGDMNWRLEYAKRYDYVFLSFNRQHMADFRNAGYTKLYWSPAAFDTELNCRIAAEKIYPVSFVGGTHPYFHAQRVMLFDFLKKKGVDLHIDAKALQDMSLIFSRSKIVLNKTMADDLNQRVFEVLGSGAFLLTNRIDARAGLEDLFTDGKHLVIYENQEHLLELIRYYLDHDEERESIAAAGHKEALEKHTYDARVVDIIRTVQEDIHGS